MAAFILLVALPMCLVITGRPARLRPDPPHVVLVTIDTARADRLTPYGFQNATMPHLDRLAAEGVVFDRAMTVAPLTLPAHASLFTALYPPGHGVRDNADAPLGPENHTLAEHLQDAGYRTAGFVGSVVLARDRGLAQGFATYDDTMLQARTEVTAPARRADDVISAAIAWIDRARGRPFFLWTHLFDAHHPYEPPEPFRSRSTDPYVAELEFIDAQLGRLLAALDAQGLAERTLVIVAGDHGEALGDHGEAEHGIFVYESVIRVPLLMRAPGVAARRVGSLVRLIDVMPTVLALLDLPAPPVDGVSLRPLLDGADLPHSLEGYAESMYPRRFGWSPLRALTDGRYKFIEAPRPELYDLRFDPFETTNLVAGRPALASAMQRRLIAFRDESGDRDGQPAAASPAVQERLRALGYVGAGPAVGAAASRRPDPKDCIAGFGRQSRDPARPGPPGRCAG